MGTDSFVIYVKTEDVYEDIADNVKKCFDISNNGTDDKRPQKVRTKTNWSFQR